MAKYDLDPDPCPYPTQCSLLMNALGAECLNHPRKRLRPGEELPKPRRRTQAPRRTWARGLGDAERARARNGGISGKPPAG